MSFQAVALALPNLLGAWNLADAANSTTASDLGPYNYSLTYSSAKVVTTPNVNGLTYSTQFTGNFSAGRSSVAQLQVTGAVTVAGTITATKLFSLSDASYYVVAGRVNNYQLRLNWNGSLSWVVWTTNGILNMTTIPLLTTNKIYFLAGTFDGGTACLYVNGRSVYSKTLPGSIAVTADPLIIGGGPALTQDLNVAAVYIYGRSLNAGQVRQLYLEGTTSSPAADMINYDHLYDRVPVIGVAAEGSPCAACGGARRVNEPIISNPDGAFHPGCYGQMGRSHVATLIGSTSSQADIVAMTQRLLWDNYHTYLDPITDTIKSTYFDGTFLQPKANVPGIEIQFAPFAGLAILHRLEGLPSLHWATKVIADALDRLVSNQSAVGGWGYGDSNGNPNDFLMAQVAETILYMRGSVPLNRYNGWLQSLEAAGNYMLNQPGNSANSSESNYYVNGNREAQELAGYWWLYRLTGQQKWLSRYDTQYIFLTAPPSNARSQYPAPASDHYGLITVTTPTMADGSDGQGYIQERDPAHTPPVYNQTGYDGYDPNYSMLCNSFLTRLWQANRDPRILRIINMQMNMVLDPALNRVNRTTWIVDGTGGSRQNNSGTIVPGACFMLAWQAGRPGLFSGADLAGIWQATYNTYAGALNGSSGSIYRGLNLDLGTIIEASNQWPGLPA